MKIFPLTKGYSVAVSDEDYHFVAGDRWVYSPGGASAPHCGYAERTTPEGKVKMHRFLLKATRGLVVDHIHGCFLPGHPEIVDNRRENLRLCSPRDNRRGHFTKSSGLTSRFRGVSWHEGAKKWQARFCLNEWFDADKEVAAAEWIKMMMEKFWGAAPATLLAAPEAVVIPPDSFRDRAIAKRRGPKMGKTGDTSLSTQHSS